MAIRSIPKGTKIFQDDEEEMLWIQKKSIRIANTEIKKLYQDFCVSKGGAYGCPSSFNSLTPAWYLNHSRKPNLEVDGDYRFFAKRAIKRGEELTVDYSTYSDGLNHKMR